MSAARELCELAPPSQTLVSRTITDLVAGSGIEFEELDPVRLESLDRDWPLFRVER